MKKFNFKKSFGVPLLSFVLLWLVGISIGLALDAFIQLLLIYVLINMILAMSLNLVNGFTGQFSLGHAGFMAVGAYFSAWLSLKFPPEPGFMQIFSFAVFAILGGLLAAAAGFIVGLPSLRLKGDYLAIITLGFGEIIRVILLNTNEVGGARGLPGIPGFDSIMIGSFEITKFFLSMTHTLFWVLLCLFFIWRLMQSSHGRNFLAVREDEVAAEAMGVDTTSAKVKAFVISSFFAGVAGSLFAHYANYLTPASFSFTRSVDVVIMVVLGGMGSLSGSLLAAVFITLVPELLRPLQEITKVDLRMVIYSLSLILIMILRPQGLFGHKELSLTWLKKLAGKKS